MVLSEPNAKEKSNEDLAAIYAPNPYQLLKNQTARLSKDDLEQS
jgi:hypothetical protein